VNDKDTTSQSEVKIPTHLLPALRAAAVLEVEMACDGEWGEDVHLERVEAAIHMRDALAAGNCTREQVSVLARDQQRCKATPPNRKQRRKRRGCR
jgi:hypothetical protein